MAHRVIVGNIGTVYDGCEASEAKKTYNEYLRLSHRETGAASNEPVTWMQGDTIKRQYVPDTDED